ncbi:MAG: glycoside hydrolase family 97 protein [Caulobacter sp.]
MSILLRTLPLCACLIAGAAQAQAPAPKQAAASPDGRTVIAFAPTDGGLPSFSVTRAGKPVIAPSALGLRTNVAGFGAKGFDLVDARTSTVDQTYDLVLGKTRTVRDRYTELTLTFRETGGERSIAVVARAYDDGVALRYVVPGQPGFESFTVSGERTEFMFPKDYSCWGVNFGRFEGGQEGEYDPVKVSAIRQFHLFGAPLVCRTGEGRTTFALAEADVKNYPTTFFARRGDNALGVVTKMPPRSDGGVAKVAPNGEAFHTPWRVVMIGDAPGDLAASNLISSLAAPTAIEDTRWIKGGKSAWDWWNGYDAPVAKPGVNTETYLAYIDFAAAMGLDYILMDEGWYVGFSEQPKLGSDVTSTVPEIDMPAIVAHARAKGVRVMVWLQWKQLDRQMDEAFAAYEKWGLAGVKVDFMNRADQEMVDFYHKVLSKAAEHRLLVDLHGAYAPNGLARTYPNFVTQEGVLGAEYNKWSSRITARHNVTLPFTRMILGPIDYTPGGFGNVTPETFAFRNERPVVMTTRGQAIAMYVVYDSPVVMVADAPQAYRKADGTWEDGVDFIQAVPTTWDETRVLQGDIGEFVVTARRKGATWYVGAMTNEQGREVSLPLGFLGKGRFKARVWRDGATPTSLSTSISQMGSADVLRLKLAPSGGAAAILEPVK